MSGKYEIYTDNKGQHRFRLKAANGQNILSSEGYSSREACDNGVVSVRRNAGDEAQYERKESQNGKHYFVLKAKNHQVIGQSQMYDSAPSMEAGLQSVMANGPTDRVEDLTG